MTDFEFVIAVVAISAGALVAIVGISQISSLIKTWINRKKGRFDEEAFNRLARAFSKHKKDSEHRIQNLEAIIAGDERANKLDSPGQSIQDGITAKNIEIEDASGPKEKSETDSSNLRNMLRE